MLIDTHCHISDLEFDADRDAVIERALSAGVKKMIVIGTGLASSQRALTLAEKHPFIWATVGLHPHDAKELDDSLLATFRKMAGHPKVVGIGEMGFDLFYNHSSLEMQRHAFIAQIRLAKEKQLPLVIHTRDAWPETFELFEKEEIRTHAAHVGVVLHCFTGDKEIAERGIDFGCYLSFSGIMTFKKAFDVQEAAASVDINKILVETDAPYLAPQGKRGKRNEPAYVTIVAQRLAELRNMSFDSLCETTTRNAEHLFRLSTESAPS